MRNSIDIDINIKYDNRIHRKYGFKFFIGNEDLMDSNIVVITNKVKTKIIESINKSNITLSDKYRIDKIDVKYEVDPLRCGKVGIVTITTLEDPDNELKFPEIDIGGIIMSKINTQDYNGHVDYDYGKPNKHIIDKFNYVEDIYEGFLLVSKEEYKKIWYEYDGNENKINAYFHNICKKNNIFDILYQKLLVIKRNEPTAILDSMTTNVSFDAEDYYRIDVETKYSYIINYNIWYNKYFDKHYNCVETNSNTSDFEILKDLINNLNFNKYIFIDEFYKYKFGNKFKAACYQYYIIT